MAIADTIKGIWQGPKKWIVVGGIAGLGYLWWTRARGGTGLGATTPAGAAAISPGGAAVADPIVPAGGDYSPPPAAPAARPSNNGEWLAQSVEALNRAPYNMSAIAVFNALTGALGGSPLTTAELDIAEKAIQLKGTPPEGMPPLNAAPTNNTPPTTGPIEYTRQPNYATQTHTQVAAGESVAKFIGEYFDGNMAEWVRINADTPTASNIHIVNGSPVFKQAMTYRLPAYVNLGNALPF